MESGGSIHSIGNLLESGGSKWSIHFGVLYESFLFSANLQFFAVTAALPQLKKPRNFGDTGLSDILQSGAPQWCLLVYKPH